MFVCEFCLKDVEFVIRLLFVGVDGGSEGNSVDFLYTFLDDEEDAVDNGTDQLNPLERLPIVIDFRTKRHRHSQSSCE